MPFREPLKSLYYRLRVSTPVWRWMNADAMAAYRSLHRTLDGTQQRLAEALRRDGMAITHVDELFPGQALLGQLQVAAEVRRGEAKTKTKKTFLMELLELDPLYDPQDPFWTYALHPRLLDVVDAYLGLTARFFYVMATVTRLTAEGEEARQSQRWHRDPEDRRMCKVFIYLTDVDEGAGPFMYVKGSQGGGKWRGLYPQRPPAGSYPPVGAIDAAVPREDVQVCLGRAGTVIFADTSGLHKGGYATKRERLMATAGFLTDASPWPAHYRLPAGVSLASLDPLARAALESRGATWKSASY